MAERNVTRMLMGACNCTGAVNFDLCNQTVPSYGPEPKHDRNLNRKNGNFSLIPMCFFYTHYTAIKILLKIEQTNLGNMSMKQ